MRIMRVLVLVLGAVCLSLVGAALSGTDARAQGDVVELHKVKGEQGELIVAVSANGITFIDPKEKKVFRAFKSKRKSMKGYKPDWVIIRDVDGDGTSDIIGAGAPAFIVTGGAAPIYSIPKGCGQFHLANFAGDKTQEILCRDGARFRLYNYDGQGPLWDYKITGLRLGVCNFGDLDGDLKADMECEVLGKGTYMQRSIEGEELGQRDSPQLDPPEDDTPGYATLMANYLKGQEAFDLDGDGSREESVLLDGKAIVVRSRASPKALARHEVGKAFSVLVDDIDGDNKVEIVVGGAGKVFILSDEGKTLLEIKTDPKGLKRRADVKVARINANGLADSSDTAVTAVIDKSKKKLSACYAGNVKKNAFTRVGNIVYALNVGAEGKVKKVEKLHSALDDKKVEGCLIKALKGAKFSKATGPGATVTLTLEFGFIDE